MRRIAVACACISLLVVTPAQALAQETTRIPIVPSTLQWIMSLVGLGVAIIGLYLISGINKLTKGGAIAGRAGYIIVAFMLLGISSILNVAVYAFKIEINYDFLAHIDEALKIVSMGFFVLYFQRVLAGLRGYMTGLGPTERTFVEDAGGSAAGGGGAAPGDATGASEDPGGR